MTSVRRLAVCLGCCVAGLAVSPVVALGEGSFPEGLAAGEGTGASSSLESSLVTELEKPQAPEEAKQPSPEGSGTGSSSASPSSGEASGASPFNDQLVVPGPVLLQAEQLEAERQARLASPEAVAAREESEMKYSGLSGGEVGKVTREAFPSLIDEPAGGPPALPAGESISRFPAVNIAQVDGAAGKHSVIESTAPMAIQTAQGLTPIDLSLSEEGDVFKPMTPLVDIQIPRRLSQGVSLANTGVSLVPVDEQGSALGLSEGSVDGAAVMYANTQTDTDTLVKPTTSGFEMDTVLRSVHSPTRLDYEVGMPEGASLVEEGGAGSVRVVDEGATIARILAPAAHDAEGSPVPLSVKIVSGDLISVSVASFAEGRFKLPIVVDPTADDVVFANGYGNFKTEWHFVHEGGEFKAPEYPEGAESEGERGTWTETIGGNHSGTEWGGLFYNTRGASKIVRAYSEGHWNDSGSHIQDYMILYSPNIHEGTYTEDYDLMPESTESWFGYACAPELKCPETTAGKALMENTNEAAYLQVATGSGGGTGGTNTLRKAYVEIEQTEGPTLEFNKSSERIYNSLTKAYVPNVLYSGHETWLGPHYGSFEVRAKDPGIGLSSYRIGTIGWGEEKPYFSLGDCRGIQCPVTNGPTETEYQGYTYKAGMTNGEDSFEAYTKDYVGLEKQIYPQTVKVDYTPPHNIKLTGLQNGNELPMGEPHLKIEATDGEGTTKSSGVQSIGVSVEGRAVSGTSASCPEGPCSANAEFTFASRDYTTGTHSMIVTATDNAGNVAEEEFTFRVHGANPVSMGPGSVDPSSGQFTLGATDVSLTGLTGVSRAYQSRDLTAGGEGPFGPQWAINLGGSEGLVVEPTGNVVLDAGNGGQTTYVLGAKGELASPTGDSNLKLEYKPEEHGEERRYVLSDANTGTETIYQQPAFIQSTSPVFGEAFGSEPGGLQRPGSDALDASGNLWVVDSTGDRVVEFSPTGALLNEYGSNGTAGGEFTAPFGIAVNQKTGNVYVTDTGGNRIEELSSSGAFVKAIGWGVSNGKAEYETCTSTCQGGIAGSGIGQFNAPEGLAVDSTGNIWVVDSGNNRVQELNEAGTNLQRFGSTGSGANQFTTPMAIALAAGNVYVTDQGNNRIDEYSTSGVFTQTMGFGVSNGEEKAETCTSSCKAGNAGTGNGQYDQPRGLATDPVSGNLYVTELGDNRVQEVTTAGVFVTKFGSGGSGEGQFAQPMGVVVSSPGDIYVTDYEHAQVQAWSRPKWWPTAAKGPLTTATTYTYAPVENSNGTTTMQPSEALAPTPVGVSCGTKATELKAGCRALTFKYATATTAKEGENQSQWGEYKGRLTQVIFHAWNPSTKAMEEKPVAQYSYDFKGRLRAEWDPRLEHPLKLRYGYDAEGHVTALTPPGQESWAFTYGTISGDSSTGRLLKVTRAPVSAGLWGGEVPQNTALPKVTGAAVVGVTLGVSTGTWNNGPVAYAYQWEDCGSASGGLCTPIRGAINANYTLTTHDKLQYVGAVVTAINGGGSMVAASARTSVVEVVAATQYNLSEYSEPNGIAAGPDGNMWFVNEGRETIGKSTPAGVITEYGLPNSEPVSPHMVTPGPEKEGALWFTEEDILYPYSYIGKITTSGSVTEYELPPGSRPYGITVGPDGNLWFTDAGSNEIGKMTTSGKVTEYKLPSSSKPHGIAPGPDGNLWFTNLGTNKIGKITTSGTVTEYSNTSGSEPYEIVAGPAKESALWFTNYGDGKIGKITTSGTVKQYSLGSIREHSQPDGIVAGTDGNLWFTERGGGVEIANRIGKITTAGTVTEFELQLGGSYRSYPTGMSVGPMGEKAVWFTEPGVKKIAKINLSPSQGEIQPPQPGSTIEYGVPLSGAEGSHLQNLTKGEVEKWGQKDDAVEGAAIFPPDEPQGWPASGYKRATVTYWDNRGRSVNAATPTGGVSTSEYNEANETTRTLSADNHAAALKEGCTSVEKHECKSAETAEKLDTKTEYNLEETNILKTTGPEHKVKLSTGGEVLARAITHNYYSQSTKEAKEKKEAEEKSKETYNLLTKTTGAALLSNGEEKDMRETVTSYNGQEDLGWKLRKPTSVTSEPNGLNLTSTTVYDKETGNVVETQSPAAAGKDAKVPPSYILQFGSKGTESETGKFKEPRGIALAKNGNLFVVDTENNRVEEFTQVGKYETKFGSVGTASGQMKSPYALAVDPSGNVWVTDNVNNRLDEFTEKGVFVKALGFGVSSGASELQTCTTSCKVGLAGSGPGQFQEPRGIGIGGGNVYVADGANNRVEKFTEGGAFVSTFGYGVNEKGEATKFEICTSKCKAGTAGSGAGQFNAARGLTVAPSGFVWVADSANNRIQGYSGEGKYELEFGSLGTGPGQFKEPNGIGVTPGGTLLVGDGANNRVQEFTSAGTFIASFGEKGKSNGQFEEAWGIAATSTGNLYVVDRGNNRVQEWVPAVSGNESAHDTRTIYYTNAANSEFSSCGGHPEWANLLCKTVVKAQPGAGGLPELPESTVAAYNIWDDAEETEEKFGPVAKPVIRTKIQTYDPAGRALTSEETATPANGASLPPVTNKYNSETGALETQSALIGGKEKTTTSKLNTLGQQVEYTDAEGNIAKYTYEAGGDGRLVEVNEGKGAEAKDKQTFSYNTTTGFMEKLINTDANMGTAEGTFTATYDVQGRMTGEVYPNGMCVNTTLNPVGSATTIEYLKPKTCNEPKPTVWFSDTIVPSIHGETLEQTSTLANEKYSYDNAGRLTEAQETPTGKGCTTRGYAYDEEGNRTSLTTRESGTETCSTEGGATEWHTYDTANRPTDAGIEYETFGNITKMPAVDAGGHEIVSTYYVDSQIASEEQSNGLDKYVYDPAGRTMETTTENKETKAKATIITHYAGSGNALTWTSEGSEKWTRNIPGIDGSLDAIEEAGKSAVLQLHDLQGNIVGMVGDSESELKLTSTYNSTEFGVPSGKEAPPKYAWLGAAGLSSEPSQGAGTSTQGGSSYVPEVGRSLQTGPIASPGSFPNGTGGVGIVGGAPPAGLINQLREIGIQNEAAREEAKAREAYENEGFCEKYPDSSACHVDGPGEGNCEPGECEEGEVEVEAEGGLGDPIAHAAGGVDVACETDVQHPHNSKHGPGTVNVVFTIECDTVIYNIHMRVALFFNGKLVAQGFEEEDEGSSLKTNAAVPCRSGKYQGWGEVSYDFPPGFSPQAQTDRGWGISLRIKC